MAGHAIEARVPGTSIRVGAGHTVSTVSTIACTAMLTRSVVIAHGVDITRVRFRIVTREDLSARPGTECVSSIARAVEGVGAGVCA